MSITENMIKAREYVFVRHFQTATVLDTVDETLNFISLCWATNDEIHYNVDAVNRSLEKIEMG